MHKDSIIFPALTRQLVIVLGGSEIVTGSCSPGKEARALVKWAQEVEFSHGLRSRVGRYPHPQCCSQYRTGTCFGVKETQETQIYADTPYLDPGPLVRLVLLTSSICNAIC